MFRSGETIKPGPRERALLIGGTNPKAQSHKLHIKTLHQSESLLLSQSGRAAIFNQKVAGLIPHLLLSTHLSVLEQDSEPQIAPSGSIVRWQPHPLV